MGRAENSRRRVMEDEYPFTGLRQRDPCHTPKSDVTRLTDRRVAQFLLHGDELGRTQQGDDNTYASKTGNDVTMGTVLVIANQTIGNNELTAAVSERIERGTTTFHLLVPVNPTPPVIAAGLAAIETGAIAVVDLPDQRELAAERLEGGLAWFENLGATATGDLEPGDVVAAVVSLVRAGEVDEIVVSTLPSRLSRWLKQDLPHRLCKAVTVPVSVVTAQGAQPAR